MFVCCLGPHTLPSSPDEGTRVKRKSLDVAATEESERVPGKAASTAHGNNGYKKLQMYEGLLPGQLPDSPRDAEGLASILEGPAKGSAVSLLEDGLANDGRGKSFFAASCAHATAGGNGQLALVVPPHLLPADAAAFDTDFRGGEQVTALPSVSSNGASHGQCRGSSNNTGLSSGEPGAASGFSPLDLMLLPDGPMAHAVSRRSGRRRLHKLHRIPALPALPPDDNGSAEQGEGGSSGDSTVNASSGRPPAALRGIVPAAEAGPGSREAAAAATPHSTLALHRLQRELAVAAQLPRDCAVLLLPYRVYAQPDLVHVVYDGAGEELLSYLRQRQRLPEATCRGVMRQLLQVRSLQPWGKGTAQGLYRYKWLYATATLRLHPSVHGQTFRAFYIFMYMCICRRWQQCMRSAGCIGI